MTGHKVHMEHNKGNQPCFIRLYVGGLGSSVTKTDLESTFSSLGRLCSVDMVRTKGRNFAYISFEAVSPHDLQRFFSLYNGCMWKGGRLKLEKAKEHYLDKLSREWAECDDLTKELTLHPTEPQSSCLFPKFEKSEGVHIFFPKLRKVKKIPMSGLGKHKRSFQRVDPLPCSLLQVCNCNECSWSSSIHQGIFPAGQVEQLLKNEGKNLEHGRMRILAKKAKTTEETSFEQPVGSSAEAPKMHKQIDCVDVEGPASCSGGVVQLKKPLMKVTANAGIKVDHVMQNMTHNEEETQKSINEPVQRAGKSADIPNKQETKISLPMGDSEGSEKRHEPEKIEERVQAGVATEKSMKNQLNGSDDAVWVQKASWKSLVGETGRVSFTLGNMLGRRLDTPLDSPTVGANQMTDVRILGGFSSLLEQRGSMAPDLKMKSPKMISPPSEKKNSVVPLRFPATGSRGNMLTQVNITPPQGIESPKEVQVGTPNRELKVLQPTNPSSSSPKVDGHNEVCMFMRSATSEQEWLESKRIVKDLVKRRRKDALRGIKMLRRPSQHD